MGVVDLLGRLQDVSVLSVASMVHQPVGEGKIQAEALITHRLGISEAEVLKGFQLASNSATIGDIKVMFSW